VYTEELTNHVQKENTAGTPKESSAWKKEETERWCCSFFWGFQKGVKVTQDLIRDLKKPVDIKKAKATVDGYKREYQAYKRRGGNKSYGNWILDKGYGKRNSGCCIM